MTPKLFGKAFKAFHILAEVTCPTSSAVGPFSTTPPCPIILFSFAQTTVSEHWLLPGTVLGAVDIKI